MLKFSYVNATTVSMFFPPHLYCHIFDIAYVMFVISALKMYKFLVQFDLAYKRTWNKMEYSLLAIPTANNGYLIAWEKLPKICTNYQKWFMNPRYGRSLIQNFSRKIKLKYNSIISILFPSIRIFFIRQNSWLPLKPLLEYVCTSLRRDSLLSVTCSAIKVCVSPI